MKLFKIKRHKSDYYNCLYFQFLEVSDRCLFQFSMDFEDEMLWPYLQIILGGGRLVDVIFSVLKLSLCFSVGAHPWNYEGMEERMKEVPIPAYDYDDDDDHDYT